VKDKVDVLLEVERLKTGREELLTEVQSLHAQLEQERSKVHDLAKGSEKQKSKVCAFEINAIDFYLRLSYFRTRSKLTKLLKLKFSSLKKRCNEFIRILCD
jgi:hypothetical protein